MYSYMTRSGSRYDIDPDRHLIRRSAESPVSGDTKLSDGVWRQYWQVVVDNDIGLFIIWPDFTQTLTSPIVSWEDHGEV